MRNSPTSVTLCIAGGRPCPRQPAAGKCKSSDGKSFCGGSSGCMSVKHKKRTGGDDQQEPQKESESRGERVQRESRD
jgi:hypothetical protein